MTSFRLFVYALLMITFDDASQRAEPLADTADHSCPFLFVSWNGHDIGRSKSSDDIAYMARTVREADIVALQEVVAGKGFGAQTVAALAAELSKDGDIWDYVISDPTQPKSPGVERYAYLIKSTVSFSRRSAILHAEVGVAIDREPYSFIGTFGVDTSIEFLSFHAVPKSKSPQQEVESAITMPDLINMPRVIFAGDFNLNRKVTDPLFAPLGYIGHITQETTLKQTVTSAGDYTSHQYDNIYTKGIKVCESGVIDFVTEYFSPIDTMSLTAAREISDHLPVYIRFK